MGVTTEMYHFEIADTRERCSKCGSTNVVSVNVSAFWDIPERETHCRDCGEVI